MKNGSYTDTHIVFSPRAYGFAVKTGTNAQLLDGIDLGLREIKDRSPGTLQQLKRRYLEAPESQALPLWVLILLFFLVLVGIVALIFIVTLRFQVGKHTLALTRQRDELQRLTEEAEKANKELE